MLMLLSAVVNERFHENFNKALICFLEKLILRHLQDEITHIAEWCVRRIWNFMTKLEANTSHTDIYMTRARQREDKWKCERKFRSSWKKSKGDFLFINLSIYSDVEAKEAKFIFSLSHTCEIDLMYVGPSTVTTKRDWIIYGGSFSFEYLFFSFVSNHSDFSSFCVSVVSSTSIVRSVVIVVTSLLGK